MTQTTYGQHCAGKKFFPILLGHPEALMTMLEIPAVPGPYQLFVHDKR
jgi:hypothetical protein